MNDLSWCRFGLGMEKRTEIQTQHLLIQIQQGFKCIIFFLRIHSINIQFEKNQIHHEKRRHMRTNAKLVSCPLEKKMKFLNTTPISFVFKFQLILISDKQRENRTVHSPSPGLSMQLGYAAQRGRAHYQSAQLKIAMLSTHASNKKNDLNL